MTDAARVQVAQRFKQALQDSRKSIRWLHRTLKNDGVRGASYASVHSYLKARTEPPLDFLTAAAKALGVRPEWLIAGEGAPTRAALNIESWVDPWEEIGTRRGLLTRRIREQLLVWVPMFERLPRTVRHLFVEAVIRFVEASSTPEKMTDVQIAQLAGDLWLFVERPLKAWGFRHELDPGHERFNLNERAFADYAVAMLHALMLAIPGPRRGDAIGRHTKRAST